MSKFSSSCKRSSFHPANDVDSWDDSHVKSGVFDEPDSMF